MEELEDMGELEDIQAIENERAADTVGQPSQPTIEEPTIISELPATVDSAKDAFIYLHKNEGVYDSAAIPLAPEALENPESRQEIRNSLRGLKMSYRGLLFASKLYDFFNFVGHLEEQKAKKLKHTLCPHYKCPHYYMPVCGSDGKTYSNHMCLKAASCRSKSGIDLAWRGECER